MGSCILSSELCVCPPVQQINPHSHSLLCSQLPSQASTALCLVGLPTEAFMMWLLTQNRCLTKPWHHVHACHGYICPAGPMCAVPSPLPATTNLLIWLITEPSEGSRSVTRAVINALIPSKGILHYKHNTCYGAWLPISHSPTAPQICIPPLLLTSFTSCLHSSLARIWCSLLWTKFCRLLFLLSCLLVPRCN